MEMVSPHVERGTKVHLLHNIEEYVLGEAVKEREFHNTTKVCVNRSNGKLVMAW